MLVFAFVITLFLLWGIAISMGDVLNRHFQRVLGISKSRSSLVQLSIFGAYAIMGIPAGIFIRRFGYKSGVLLGLLLYSAGAFSFIFAANAQSFSLFRLALLILACGLATLETVAHPFAAALGDQRTSDMRLNLSQSFNGLGAILGPIIGGYFLLRHTETAGGDLSSVKSLYTVIGIVILCIAVCFSFVRVPVFGSPPVTDPQAYEVLTGENPLPPPKKLFRHRHFKWAIAAQFFNVAAQGGTWAYFINYGVEKIQGMTDVKAAYYFSFSMFLLMVGRFVSTWLMRYIAPNLLLAIYAVANAVLCVIIAQNLGWPSFIAMILLNFFMSIMYPTIFSLGLKDLGDQAQQASSFIVMGVVGGALFPPVMGLVANHNIAAAYYLPIVCYAVIFLFGWKFYKIKPGRHVPR
jgi:FHS family L-fucose permease-like MFS transporter